VLAKVNVDENPRISQTFQVQSIPAVYAMRDRKVVGGFVGAKARPEIERFVADLAPSAEEREVVALIAAGDEGSLRKALELDPDHAGAIVALAEVLVGDGRGDEAVELLGRIPETAETRRVAALARTGSMDPGVDVEAKLEALLDRVKSDEEARREFLDLLEILGPDDPRTPAFRRRLTAQLY
jgi:putative thioredoxin